MTRPADLLVHAFPDASSSCFIVSWCAPAPRMFEDHGTAVCHTVEGATAAMGRLQALGYRVAVDTVPFTPAPGKCA